ncbi:T9SS type A sorting domain-containing protein [candidate division KSB1 bacterium]|nr:T9SS type A sorting domain-containing protein [candidate division KSB1 bacterium]
MNKTRTELYLFCLLAGLGLFAATPVTAVPDVLPFGVYEGAGFSPTITVTEFSADRVRLHLVMENLPTGSAINFNNPVPGTWDEMNASGTLVPRFTIFLALPSTGNPAAVIEDWQTTTFNVNPTINIPENNPNPAAVMVGDVGILGGVRVVPVTFRPIQYANSSSTCAVVTEATVSIEIDDQTGQNPVTTPRTAFSRTWQKVYQSVLTNWESIPSFYTSEPSHILLIYPDSYSTNLSSWIRWKEERGIKVTALPKNSIGGNPSATQVHDRIVQELNASSPRIDYVLLCGDETQLPISPLHTDDPLTRFSQQSYNPGDPYTNEAYFSCVQGSDVFPDLFIGRWIVNTPTEVQNVVARTILHERDTFVTDSLRFERAAVAADEQYPSQRLTKRRVKTMLWDHGFPNVDSLWGDNQGPTPLINSVTQGVTFVNYRGTGWDIGWAGIGFYLNSINQLNNVRKPCIVTGIGCGVGKFDGPDGFGFGEDWMLVGTVSQPKGAAGFIGPCWNTHTVYNDCLDSSLYRAFLDWHIPTLGAALASGKMQAWGIFDLFLETDGDVREVTETMLRQYLVLSDPSLQVFTDTPLRLDVSLPPAVPSGNFNLELTVGNMAEVEAESLNVTVWYQAGQFVTRWMQPGQSLITIPVVTTGLDSIGVTITGDNVLAFHRVLDVGPVGPFLAHGELALTDNGNGDGLVNPGETIAWSETARNIGTEIANSAAATLTTTTGGVGITVNSATFGNIPAGGTAVGASPYSFSVAPTISGVQQLEFVLHWTSQNGEPTTSNVYLDLHVPSISLTQTVIQDGENGIWERGELIDLQVTLANSGNATLLGGQYSLVTADEYTTIVSAPVDAPQIAAGTDYDFPENSFRLQASGGTPSGHPVALNLSATIQMGSYLYQVSLPIQLTIGQIGPHDPLSDADGFYWLYDNTDVEYSAAPNFQWLEIAPAAGGPGTLLEAAQSDQTFRVRVPFSFTYDGVAQDTLSVSTDGWVRPGPTSATNYANTPFPNPGDNISSMIAVLWDDLFYRFGETGQLAYYYDTATDRFVVEWYQVHDWQTGTYRSTFQLQLLNPATYPTQSGNAQWVFLYNEVSTRALSNSGATVGFENLAQDDGATYFSSGQYAQSAAALDAGRQILLTTTPPVIVAADPEHTALPQEIELAQNFPNPFNPETTIQFSLPRSSPIRLEIFDVLGRSVALLSDNVAEAGIHRLTWNGRSEYGTAVGSGIYFYRLSTPLGVLTRKMILMK